MSTRQRAPGKTLLHTPRDDRLRAGESVHVAIVSKAVGERLRTGQKRIETRFSTCKRFPYNELGVGDGVVFKCVGGPLVGWCRVRRVWQCGDLTPERMRGLRLRFGRLVAADDAYWQARSGARYGLLAWLGPLRPPPPVVVPRQYGSGWTLGRVAHERGKRSKTRTGP